MKFTIITNTIRRQLDLVEKSVRASLSQGDDIELILVDQNSNPISFPKDIQSNSRFHHQHEVVPAVSMARNKAKYASSTEWLIFCDDDGYLEKDYVKKLKQLITAHPEVEIFAGAIKRTDNQDFYSKRHAVGGNMSWFMNSKLLMGSNFVIRRKAFEMLGKFDENFGAGARFGSGEETDLAWNAFFHHCKMRYSPELVVLHIPPFATETALEVQKAYRYGVGKGKLVKKWLQKGHFTVSYELFEMILIPILKMPLYLLSFRFPMLQIQWASFRGRISGLFQ